MTHIQQRSVMQYVIRMVHHHNHANTLLGTIWMHHGVHMS